MLLLFCTGKFLYTSKQAKRSFLRSIVESLTLMETFSASVGAVTSGAVNRKSAFPSTLNAVLCCAVVFLGLMETLTYNLSIRNG
ncbi:hypothetical protein BV898_15650 [Hypsibius exemplaris]|uniref:Uncharacterized protein n=1 Tax=Hypsibius exemplaris TaxID=2072580 RepID=A0A9X6RKY0_HYPEX|nr:hypothetical protein BV898_15650 [Hypsibius exemplaris]